MSSILTDVIPAKARKYVYLAFALAGIVVGALTVAGIDTGSAADVLTYVGVALGLTAASNTSTSATTEDDAEE
ncbi:hypothetical protein [Nocardioides sp. GY 10127]|uniref:hypothetical protein n=1 Tax=Nocardioides sp. GY 10127 TaxID=2569762 RepID=UPI0010A8241E|nr:hypothetical protein [Nocardioides sp. GY 10127]TIC78762.1 hypothetical protein E8D37_18880 [Nocardioides sp. GY 10127]